MNFLDLCRRLELESGTVDPAKLTASVNSATGRQVKIVGWVQAAWTIIQGARSDWRFMRRDYAAPSTIAQPRYAGAALAGPRFGGWLRDRRGYRPHGLFDPAIGASDFTELCEIDWQDWRSRYGRGVAETGRPTVYAIAPDERMCLGPTPDTVYMLSGEYRASEQRLAANADVPEMPAIHHDAIVWRALMLLGDHDEAGATIATARDKFIAAMEKIERDQTDAPRLAAGRAIA